MARLESSQSIKMTTGKAAKKWLITATGTTATTTSSNAKITTIPISQDREVNSIATTRKVSRTENVLVRRLIVTLTF